MTKRYPLGGALGGGNSSDAGDLQRIALGRLAAAHRAQCGSADAHESVRGSLPHGSGLGADVDHGHLCAFAKMAELFHKSPRRGTTNAIPPASQSTFSGETIRKAFDCTIATTSPEPCHGNTVTSGSPRDVSTRAGRKCVSSPRS